jgi:diadenosine tetraphosphate (Ap4A) HIT family hydrolase
MTGSTSTCAFCAISPDRTSVSTDIAVVIPHPEPITPGHTVVVSRRHVSEFFELDVEEQQIMWQIVGAVQKAIMKTESVEAFSIGFADFPEGGDGHAHIHVLPRRSGDQFKLPEGIGWVVDKV